MTSSYQTRQQFDIGRVIERTFGAVGANLVPLSLAALVLAGVPAFFWAIAERAFRMETNFTLGLVAAVVGMVIGVICGTLLQGAVTYAVVADLQGRKATLGESLTAAMRSFWVLLALGILSGIAIGLGLVLLIVPGIILSLLWFVIGPVAVAERAGVGKAFERSRDLTRNHRWWLLLLAVIFLIASGFISFILNMIVLAAVGGAAFAAGPAAGGLGDMGVVGYLALAVTSAIEALMSMIGAAGVAAVYVELRAVKEGTGHTSVAAIFD